MSIAVQSLARFASKFEIPFPNLGQKAGYDAWDIPCFFFSFYKEIP